ncbi:MAG TPA: hypothetical protein VKS81_01700 [Bacteroidota bacterium]|nr:hypothetical protein [Bacteroidota bacterium]
MKKLLISLGIACVAMVLTLPAMGQTHLTGAQSFSVGDSPVLWLDYSGGLFYNPAYLARVHQGDILMSADRFSQLSFFSGSYFIPEYGTLSAGVSNDLNQRWYSAGFGRLLSRNVMIGGALNLLSDGSDQATISLGMAGQFFDSSSPYSGLLADLSMMNVSPSPSASLAGVNAGMAYWVLPNVLSAEAAVQSQNGNTQLLLGSEARITSSFSAFLGTSSFNSIAAGAGLQESYLNIQASVGNYGLLVSLNFRFTDAARDVRTNHYDEGMKAYDEQRYYEAQQEFQFALNYDEYYSPAAEYARLSEAKAETTTTYYVQLAGEYEKRGDYREAIDYYSKVLIVNPHNNDAALRRDTLEAEAQRELNRLVAGADSLRKNEKFDEASLLYKRALDIDPDNESAISGLKEMDTKSDQAEDSPKNRPTNRYAHAQALLRRHRLEEAKKEFQHLAAIDPSDTRARLMADSLETLETGKSLLEGAKTADNDSSYYQRLSGFAESINRDPNQREAKEYLAQIRDVLRSKVSKFFKEGLQYYLKDDYRTAVQVWDKVLLIQPDHPATLDYTNRAQEKLEALGRLK